MEKPTLSPHRSLWVSTLENIARPVLAAAADGGLLETMTIEAQEPKDRRPFAVLEAVGRTLVGCAPWFACPGLAGDEARVRDELAELARQSLSQITDPGSPDYANWGPDQGDQPLVDAAFVAHALLRAPGALWDASEPATQLRLVESLVSARGCIAHMNNWLLFRAMVEAALFKFTDVHMDEPVAFALDKHAEWYLGDGLYGDGPELRADYYNSFVISPMMLDVLEVFAGRREEWDALLETQRTRAQRGAAILERMISPEGTYPPIGRSIAYRVGAFQLLAQMALRHELPEAVSPAQVRCGLSAVIERQFAAPGTFREDGYLSIGLAGSQPGLGENYISTAATYLCTAGFLPLGLPPSDPFWSGPDADWTAKALWAGADQQADHALRNTDHARAARG